MYDEFLPLCKQDMLDKGWQYVDFVLVTGDAYVDHPSFGAAIISRVLEREGYRVGILSQPDFTTCESMREYGRPRYGFFIGGGNVDSMVAHYSVAKIRRAEDEYTPGGKAGKRPDRSAIVYTQMAKRAYPDLPAILGGLEASLRRFAHYDYWDDTVMPSILETSGADIVSFGMSEHQTVEIARRLVAGERACDIANVAGTCFLTEFFALPEHYAECASFAKVGADKVAYAKACRIQMDNQDPVSGKPVVQKQSEKYLVQNIPAMPLTRSELDALYALPFTRRWHPSYAPLGGIPAIEEVEFSIIQNRGCFGGCNFCAIQLHQGRRVTSRSADSIVAEAELITKAPGFKGYIHDIGGPTANFRLPSCKQQMTKGMCMGGKHCLAPQPCGNLIVDHSEYLGILRRVRALPGIKKVFIRSGIRYDYLMRDKDETFLKELVRYHISGQLKVAPEHCAPNTLQYMGKPPVEIYNKFTKRFYELTRQAGKKQYLVPYLMSSHPGSTLRDAVILAEYLYDNNVRPEQVQDFYPTPGTVSTCMFYTELDPYTLQKVFVAKTPEEKAMQRALLQYYEPRNAQRVRQALQLVHREDLIPKLVQGGAARAADSRNSAEQREKGARRASFAPDEKAAALTPAATARTAKKAAAGGARKGTSAWPTPTNTTRRIQSSRKNVRSKKD
ncbi:MAG: YgiQ family radical SAM protein [Ruthenibacterium sp.]